MKLVVIAILILLLPVIAQAQPGCRNLPPGDNAPKSPPSYLYPVYSFNGKTGEKRFGYINNKGKLVIGFDRLPKNTIYVGEFREGLAKIHIRRDVADKQLSNYLVGYIDVNGEVAIHPRFDHGRDFHDGRAFVSIDQEAFHGFIDRTGKMVIKLDSKRYVPYYGYGGFDFQGGLAAMPRDEGVYRRRWGYIDRLGNWAIKPQYEFAGDFSEGLAQVVIDDSDPGMKLGYIDRTGRPQIAPQFKATYDEYHCRFDIYRFSEGMACVNDGTAFGYIDKSGSFLIRPQFVRCQDFSEGLAWVAIGDPSKDGKVGWIDRRGNWVISFPQSPYHSLYSLERLDWRFSEGLVALLTISKYKLVPYDSQEPPAWNIRSTWGYLDKKGKVAIDPKFVRGAGNLSWTEEVRYGGPRTDGRLPQIIREPRGYKIAPFSGGLARVDFTTSGTPLEKYGYIDKKGKFVWLTE